MKNSKFVVVHNKCFSLSSSNLLSNYKVQNQNFNKNECVKDHLSLDSKRSFLCLICGQEFSAFFDLTHHLSSRHLINSFENVTEPSIKRKLTDEFFYNVESKRKLSNDYYTNSRNDDQLPSSTITSESEKKSQLKDVKDEWKQNDSTYQCNKCGKDFTQTNDLTTNSVYNSYCQICSSNLIPSSNFKIHRKTKNLNQTFVKKKMWSKGNLCEVGDDDLQKNDNEICSSKTDERNNQESIIKKKIDDSDFRTMYNFDNNPELSEFGNTTSEADFKTKNKITFCEKPSDDNISSSSENKIQKVCRINESNATFHKGLLFSDRKLEINSSKVIETSCRCDQCRKAFNHTTPLKDHKKDHSVKLVFNCPFCQKSFPLRRCLLSHLIKLHSNALNYTIKEIGKENLEKILIKTKNLKILVPKLPDKLFENNGSDKTSGDAFVVNQFYACGKTFDQIHYNCHLCSAKFYLKNQLNDHLKSKHQNDESLDREFEINNITKLQQHVIIDKSKNVLNQKVYEEIGNLENPVATTNLKELAREEVCLVSDKIVSPDNNQRQSKLNCTTLENKHLKLVPRECDFKKLDHFSKEKMVSPICNEEFSGESNLINHLNTTEHGKITNPKDAEDDGVKCCSSNSKIDINSIKTEEETDNKKDHDYVKAKLSSCHKCNICKKEFKSVISLLDHLNMHSDHCYEKILVCPVCSIELPQTLLMSHVKTHII